jgi:hypothetical protein
MVMGLPWVQLSGNKNEKGFKFQVSILNSHSQFPLKIDTASLVLIWLT